VIPRDGEEKNQAGKEIRDTATVKEGVGRNRRTVTPSGDVPLNRPERTGLNLFVLERTGSP
jgi:hypothetical protein